MTFLQLLTTIFEIAMVVALLWCFFHEDRLIAFERKIMANIRRRRMRIVKQDVYRTPIKVRQ